MGYVSAKLLSETLDINAIETSARAQWTAQTRRRRRIEQWIIGVLPIGLILMTGIFYGLSAPHTAEIMNHITPGIGNLAPLAFELGILIFAALRAAGWLNWVTLVIVITLLTMNILINIAGGFIAVVTVGSGVADLSKDTVGELWARYGSLPATYQVVLLIVPLVGIVIPVMAKLVGEALVKLALGEIRLERQSDDELWARESAKVMYGALMQAALKAGSGVTTAGNWAASVVDQLYRIRAIAPPITVSTPVQTVKDSLTPPLLSSSAENGVKSDAQDRANDSPAPRLSKTEVKDWLINNPDMLILDDRAACREYMRQLFGVDSDTGYKTFERARKEVLHQ